MNNPFPAPVVMELNINEDGAKRAFATIKEKKALLREKRSMLKDTFLNDAKYAQLKKELDDKKKALKAVEQTLANTPAVEALKAQIKDIAEEVKDYQMNLFGHLEAFEKSTGTNAIEIDGKVRKIVKSYKLETK